MIRLGRGGAVALLLLGAACGSGSAVSPDEAASVVRDAPRRPISYTTTFAADLGPPLDGVRGTIEGVQQTPEEATFQASVQFVNASAVTGASSPRSFVLPGGPDARSGDKAVLGRLAVVPTDVLDLIEDGGDLESAGSGEGVGQEEVARFRATLAPDRLQQPTEGFLTETLSWLIGPVSDGAEANVSSSVTVTGATLEVLVDRDGSALDSLVLRVEYDLDISRLSGAVKPYLPSGTLDGDTSVGTIAGAANFRVAITE